MLLFMISIWNVKSAGTLSCEMPPGGCSVFFSRKSVLQLHLLGLHKGVFILCAKERKKVDGSGEREKWERDFVRFFFLWSN